MKRNQIAANRISIIVVMIIAMMLCTVTVSYGVGYSDVNKSHWAYEAVNAMSDKTIIKGYPNGSFLPNNTVTYGEFIKMALIADAGADVGNASKPNHWATNYYNKALELKYFTAHDIDKSQLGNQITRGDMALIISAILGDVKIDNYDTVQKGITDITYKTEHEYDITKAYATGILTGYTDYTFRPDKTLSRAESATVIYRLVDVSKRVLPVGEKEKVTSSAITYPTSGLLDMSKLTSDKTIAVSVHFTEEYELYTDASMWGIKMYRAWDGNGCAFDNTLQGHIYLIKDGEIVDYCNNVPMYDDEGISYLGYQRAISHYDISKADYIICVPSDAKSEEDDLIKVVINPFQK